VDLTASFGNNAPSLEALDSGDANDANDDPALQPRAWWKMNADRSQTIGIEETILLLRDILRKDHYEVRSHMCSCWS
jgi:hypothetical protein